MADVTVRRLCAVSYGGAANAMLCSGPEALVLATAALALATAGCDNNWNTYWVGTRTQWNVTKDFYMGVDVLYQKMNSGNTPTGLSPPIKFQAGGAVHAMTVGDPDNWSVPVPCAPRLLSLIG